MKIYRGLSEAPDDFGPSVLTVGVFDGVHRGHQALMRTVLQKADELGAVPTVVTFDRHPLEIIAPGKEPPLLTTLPQRARVIEQLGIGALVVLTFDDVFRRQSPEDFVVRSLVQSLGCLHIVVGANFRFGHKQAGTIQTLNDLGAAHGFGVTIFAMQVAREDEVVSSTLIRRHVAEGEVERVAGELDRAYRLEGYVEHGAGRGVGLGFPTANLRVPPRMVLPKQGVYVARLIWKGQERPAAVNVGVNPTFGDRIEPIVEVHILDFQGDLYGEIVEVEFLHRLRDEQRFPDKESLVEQMHRDVADTRAWFAGSGSG